MTEEEEFEFRARLEAEQAAAVAPAQRSTSVSGSLSEINKGIGRGALGLPIAVGQGLAKGMEGQDRSIGGIPGPGPDKNMETLRNTLMARMKADPNASKTEQMLGTGAELGTSMLPFAGGAGTIPQKLLGLAAPVAGGVTGEQLGGEQGKMVGTLAAPAGVALAGRALAPTVSRDMQILVEQGVQPTVGQQTGGFTKKAEGFPLIKEITGPAKARAEEQFMKGAVNVALKPLGVKIDKIDDGFDAYNKASKLASQAYDDLLPQLKVKYDPQFSAEMASQRAAVPQAIRGDLEDIFNREIIGKLPKGNANIPPRLMKEIDSELGRIGRRYMKDPAVNSQNIADGVRDIQGAFRDMVARQNPALSKELTKVNATWNNLLRVENAVNRASAANGNFTPRQFQESVKAMDSTLRRSAFAKGQAAMQEYSSAGINVLGGAQNTNVPYSALRTGLGAAGIAGGAMASGVGAGVALPAAIAGGAAASLYTAPGQRLAQMALTGPRPPALQTLGTLMRNAPPGPTLGASIPFFSRGEE